MLNAGVMTRTTSDRLTDAWSESVTPHGAPREEITGALDDLRLRYREPHRRYHTLEHLDEVLVAVEWLAEETEDTAVVQLAACFHDAIYQPTSTTNERDSALLATAVLSALGVPTSTVGRVADLVRMTSDHQARSGTDEAVLSDADLWILGAPADRYRRYVADVRAEYAHVDDAAWRSGRAVVLDGLLGRDRLYACDRFRNDFEAAARLNLGRERAAL